jgi:predicted amidohydrolase YtcJ
MLTIFLAKRIITMDDSMPEAEAVAVIGERIVAVGSVESMQVWREGRDVKIDERFKDKVLMPGFIDNHVHPFLGAILLPSEIIAPEDWRRPDGGVAKAALNAQDYREKLKAWVKAKGGTEEWLITWGYQPLVHGRLARQELDEICPDYPLYVQHRSFHEVFMNTKAMERLGLSEASTGQHPQIDWQRGHFFETGKVVAIRKLMPYLLREDWYNKGLSMLGQLCLQGGITTIADQLFGGIDPEFELNALRTEIQDKGLPLRVINIMDARNFSNRAAGVSSGPPHAAIDFAAGIPGMEAIMKRETEQIKFLRAVKLFADGAMFSQLMQLNRPGYADGHHGEWLMSPEVLAQGIHTYWQAGFQIHVHVNGDGGMDALLNAVSAAQLAQPRFDHRLTAHHLGFHAAAQTGRMAALGMLASVNPYYIHALADSYASLGLGGDRASQIVRAGSLVRAGIPVSFHSDYPMAPVEPLFLAWCAATRQTQSGKVVSPSEKLEVMQSLRGITIDAAHAIQMEHELGSIVAGKLADFTVLESDPFDSGAQGLKDIAIWGTVMNGQVHQLPEPSTSVHAHRSVQSSKAQVASTRALASPYQAAYKAVSPAECCGNAFDHCEVVRSWASLAREALLGRKLAY